MSVSAPSIASALGAIVGRDRVSDDPNALAAGAIDGTPPRWLVSPASLGEVSDVLGLAWEEGLAVTPRGSGSALDLGAPPARVDLVVDLRGLNRVVEYNPDDLTVSVEAGLALGALNRQLGERGQRLAIDPATSAARTVGGVAATNASGPLRCRYGSMRDLVLGVRFVQADGVVTWGGARVVKSVTGYDVPKLMVGSLGTLGVLGELALRLHPLPECERTWLLTVPSFERLQACLERILDSSLEPNRVEVLDAGALAGFGAGDAKAALAVSFGTVADAVREQGERLVELARRVGAAGTERPMEIWRDIERVATGTNADLVLDIATLPARIASTMRTVTLEMAARGSDVRWRLVGRATVGALCAIVPGAPTALGAALIPRLREAVAPFGGHVIVRRGPRELRRAIDPWGPLDPPAFELMRRIKHEFDARGVLNPGRFVGGL
jgi:glycolate dehydrogenase FAD-binding subunit